MPPPHRRGNGGSRYAIAISPFYVVWNVQILKIHQCAGKRTAAVFLASGRRPEARKTAASARRAEVPLGPKGLVARGAVPRGPKGRVA